MEGFLDDGNAVTTFGWEQGHAGWILDMTAFPDLCLHLFASSVQIKGMLGIKVDFGPGFPLASHIAFHPSCCISPVMLQFTRHAAVHPS
jgi:hypothetical protein